jgi:hypothetical protein
MEPNANPVNEYWITQPPPFCEYASGQCDQSFDNPLKSRGLFLYPSSPEIIANTIEASVQELGRVDGQHRWNSWKHLGITGQIIFCEICKALRFTEFVVADVTTLNFNLLFEIGYTLGWGLPVIPVRDTSYIQPRSRSHAHGVPKRNPYPAMCSDRKWNRSATSSSTFNVAAIANGNASKNRFVQTMYVRSANPANSQNSLKRGSNEERLAGVEIRLVAASAAHKQISPVNVQGWTLG